MSGKSAQPAKAASQALVRYQNIPVQMTDLSIFDDTFAFMKERFSEEMRRVDEQMLQLGKALNNFYNQKVTVQTGLTSSRSDQSVYGWDTITSSPLVQGEGEEKMLKLQFDVSQFDPTEVKVKIADDLLTVSATHNEKSDKSTVFREYTREFLLPRGTNPDTVISSLSRDGVLTVQAPLLQPAITEKTPSIQQ